MQSLKTPHQPSTVQQVKHQEQYRSGSAGTCVMLWAVGQLACAGPSAQVRPLLPADCPPEAQQAMWEWRLSDSGADTAVVVSNVLVQAVRE